MDFNKYMKIKAELEKLPNVVVESALGETSLLISHKIKGSKFEVPFTEEANGSLTVHLGKGVKVFDGIKTPYEVFQENAKKFKDATIAVFESFDKGVNKLKNCYKELPQVEDVESLKPVQESSRFEKKSAELEAMCENSSKPVASIATKFKHKILSAIQEECDFIELFNFFEGTGDSLKTHDFNFESLKNQYNETFELHQKFKSHLSKMASFHEKVEKIIGDKKIADNIINDMNFSESVKVSVPKTVVKMKNQFSESAFTVLDASKSIIKAFNETFDPDEVSDTVFNSISANDDGEHPEFLKFSKGKYTRDDLAQLEHELEQSFYILPDITDEDLRQIGDWRNQCMYMARTGIISDKMVDEIISSFNSKYTQNTESVYKDGDQALGFQSTLAMKGEVDGVADMSGASNVKDIKIDTVETPEDEEGFETVKSATIA